MPLPPKFDTKISPVAVWHAQVEYHCVERGTLVIYGFLGRVEVPAVTTTNP